MDMKIVKRSMVWCFWNSHVLFVLNYILIICCLHYNRSMGILEVMKGSFWKKKKKDKEGRNNEERKKKGERKKEKENSEATLELSIGVSIRQPLKLKSVN